MSALPQRLTSRAALLRLLLWALALVIVAAVVSLFGFQPRTGRLKVDRADCFVIVLVVSAVVLVPGALLSVALRALSRRFSPRPGATLFDQRWFMAAVVAANLALVGCVLYARYVEPRWIGVRRLELPTPKVSQRVRIVLFSDVHSDARFDVDERVAQAINAEDADVVIFAGDALNQASRLPAFRQALAAIHARSARLAIRGNWDVWYWDELDLFGGTGFEEMDAGWRTVATAGGPLQLGGHRFLDDWQPEEVLGTLPPPDGLRILVYHAHDYLERAAQAGLDLYLCADTHGGQIALPLYGPLFIIGRFGRRYASGLYQVGDLRAYVTPGLGVEESFPFRFGVRPEITVLDLVPPLRGK